MTSEKELRRALNHARRTGDGELYRDLEAQLAELEAERRAQLPKPAQLRWSNETPTIRNLPGRRRA